MSQGRPRTALVSTWGDLSHLVLSLDLADRLRQEGWSVHVVGLPRLRTAVEQQGFAFHTLAPMPSGLGWNLLAHLQRCNRIDRRAGGPGAGDPSVERSARILADLTLDVATQARQGPFVGLLEDLAVDLVLWDPTEVAAPAAAHQLDIPHLAVNFLASPPQTTGDWWCAFMARWEPMARSLRTESALLDAVGDSVELLPAWGGRKEPSLLKGRPLIVQPSEELFGKPAGSLGAGDGLIVLSTAYRTESHLIRMMVDGVRLAGLRPVVLAARSHGSPALTAADDVIERAPMASLAAGSAVVVSAAGSHALVTAASGRTPTVAVPVRVHAWWEVAWARRVGIDVCPGDELDAAGLTRLIGRARPPAMVRPPDEAWDLDQVAAAIDRSVVARS